MTDGLARSHKVVCYLSADRFDQTVHTLAARVPGLGAARDRGSVVLETVRDAYLPDGEFDPDRHLLHLGSIASEARRDGYAALRVIGQTSDLKGNGSAVRGWPAYELRSDLMIARSPVLAVCAFDARWCGGRSVETLRSLHARSHGRFPEPSSFRLHATTTGGLALAGEIDLSCSRAVADLALGAVPHLAEPSLDVSGLVFIDASGMRAVLHLLRAIASCHHDVRVTGASEMFLRLWTVMGFSGQIACGFEAAAAPARGRSSLAG